MRAVAETIAAIGERVVAAAMAQPELLRRVRLTEAETRLARIDPGYGRASTTSRLDAFLLPDSLDVRRVQRRVAGRPRPMPRTSAEVFDGLDIMARFRERFEASYFRLSTHLLDALLASYAEWGGRASPPTILITDFREVPTWSEFLILKDRFEARGVPTVVADPRDLTLRRHDAGGGRPAHRPGVSPRARQRRDRARRRLPRPGRGDRQRHGVHGQRPPLQDPAQEGVLRAADRRRRDRARRAVSAERRGARDRRRGDPVDARRRGRAHARRRITGRSTCSPTPASIATRWC